MKKLLPILVIVSFFSLFAAETVDTESPEATNSEEVNRLPDEKVTNPPENVINPAEFSKLEGVIIKFESRKYPNIDFAAYYNPLLKAITEAGVYAYILEDSEVVPMVEDEILSISGVDGKLVSFMGLPFAPDTIWARDYGPWFVYENGKRIIVNNRYFNDRPADDAIPIAIGEINSENVYNTGLSTEGGNFMTDGKGNCWVSNAVFKFNEKYNNMNQQDIKTIYHNYMGCKNIYVPEPPPAANGQHIDMFAKILNHDTLLVAKTTNELGATNAEVEALDKIAEYFASIPHPESDEQGKPKKWKIVRIPMAIEGKEVQQEGAYRTFYAHTNSLIVNKHVIVPVYGKGTDEAAIAVYREVLPEFTILQVNAKEVIEHGGAVHCTTIEVPVENYSKCGNGVISDDEECEFNTLSGKSCTSLGYAEGTLACDDSCKLDISGCKGFKCGDGIVLEGQEVCDQNTIDCTSIEGKNYTGGKATCKNNCSGFDESQCKVDGGNTSGTDGTDGTDGSDGYGESGCALTIF